MTTSNDENYFDNTLPSFDTLMTMAMSNPQGFEELRLREVDALINSAPETMQTRLRGLQFQIDAQRQLHKTPMGACIKISRMMHESFAQLRELLSQFGQQTAPLIARSSQVQSQGSSQNSPQEASSIQRSADILEFPGR